MTDQSEERLPARVVIYGGVAIEDLGDGSLLVSCMLVNEGGTTAPAEMSVRVEATAAAGVLYSQLHPLGRPIEPGASDQFSVTLAAGGQPCTVAVSTNAGEMMPDDQQWAEYAGWPAPAVGHPEGGTVAMGPPRFAVVPPVQLQEGSGQQVHVQCTLHNVGPGPSTAGQVIVRAHATTADGQTVAYADEYVADPLDPGATGLVTFTLDLHGRPCQVSVQANLRADGSFDDHASVEYAGWQPVVAHEQASADPDVIRANVAKIVRTIDQAADMLRVRQTAAEEAIDSSLAGEISAAITELVKAPKPDKQQYQHVKDLAGRAKYMADTGEPLPNIGHVLSEANEALASSTEALHAFLEGIDSSTEQCIEVLKVTKDIAFAVDAGLATGGIADALSLGAVGTAAVSAGAHMTTKAVDEAVTRGTEMAIGTRHEFGIGEVVQEVAKAGLEAFIESLLGNKAVAEGIKTRFTEWGVASMSRVVPGWLTPAVRPALEKLSKAAPWLIKQFLKMGVGLFLAGKAENDQTKLTAHELTEAAAALAGRHVEGNLTEIGVKVQEKFNEVIREQAADMAKEQSEEFARERVKEYFDDLVREALEDAFKE